MDKKQRLSHSQIRLYNECGKKYQYSYKERLREKVKSGALFFGSAFDKATEAVLKDRTIDEKAVFDEAFTKGDINGRVFDLPSSLNVVYAASDFDYDLLTEEDKTFLKAKSVELFGDDDLEGNYLQCASGKKQQAFKHWAPKQRGYYSLCNWMSLRRKGHIMLDANRKYILPRIKQVLDTQAKVELSDSQGNSLLGFADLVCIWEDGTKVIIDYKTSSIEYAEDSVLTSQQLTLYSYSLGIPRAGYIVFRKGIIKNRIKICGVCSNDGSGGRHKTCANEIGGKRCGGEFIETIRPECNIQVIIDDIPARTVEIVMENVEMVAKAINADIFPRNMSACKGPFGLCPYYAKCYRDDESDLERLEEKKND